MPASLASSTTYWINGLSTIVSISFGIALVAGSTRVPRPATGKTALRIFMGWYCLAGRLDQSCLVAVLRQRTKADMGPWVPNRLNFQRVGPLPLISKRKKRTFVKLLETEG